MQPASENGPHAHPDRRALVLVDWEGPSDSNWSLRGYGSGDSASTCIRGPGWACSDSWWGPAARAGTWPRHIRRL